MKFRIVKNIKLSPICSICDTRIKEKVFLESIGEQQKIVVICEDCAYQIHSAYESGM